MHKRNSFNKQSGNLVIQEDCLYMTDECQTMFVCQRKECKFRAASRFFWPWFKGIPGILVALLLNASVPALGQLAYAVQFNQGNNSFGSINLLNGSFTQFGSEGGTLFNDIAAAANGQLYGIVNTASLVTLNTNNGAVLSSVNFNVGGIESLAIALTARFMERPRVHFIKSIP